MKCSVFLVTETCLCSYNLEMFTVIHIALNITENTVKSIKTAPSSPWKVEGSKAEKGRVSFNRNIDHESPNNANTAL